MSPNMSSFQKLSNVSLEIKAEVAAGRLKGPFQDPPFPNFQIGPICCIPKKVSGDFRLIHHLSYPTGSSINDGIKTELASVSYCFLMMLSMLCLDLAKVLSRVRQILNPHLE